MIRRHGSMTSRFCNRAALAPLILGSMVYHVQADTQSSADSPILDEIIVTAQKRSENIQDVPMSITAITGATLEDSGARTVSDFGRLVPGLAVANTGPGQSEVIVRGISSGIELGIFGNVATVGYYLDETPVSDISRNLDAALIDLERVEVLRGPQGTLYGTGSEAGAIRYISRKAEFDRFSASVDAGLSDTTSSGQLNREFSGVFNIPLVDGKLAARVVAFYQGWGGYIDRYRIGPENYDEIDPTVPPQKDANSYRLGGGRISLRYQPAEGIEIVPTVLYQKTVIDEPSTVDGPIGSVDNPIQVEFVPEPSSDTVKLASLTATVKSLPIEIVSATSYYDRTQDSIEDWSKLASYLLAETPYPFDQFTRFKQSSWTEELRFSKDWNSFRAVVGLYYQNRNNGLIEIDPVYPGYNQTFGTSIDSFFSTYENIATKEQAAFTEVSYHLTSSLELTAGLRQSRNEQTHTAVSGGFFNGGFSTDDKSSSSNSTTPKFGASYQLTPDSLVYATVAKGARPGGSQHSVPIPFCTPDLQSLGLAQAPTAYAPDHLWSYEVGSKNRLDGGRVVLNASVYYIDWTNIQQQVNLACGFPLIANFGKARSEGSELSANWQLPLGWKLSGNAAYTEATAQSVTFGIPVQVGDPLLNTPRWQLGGAADYARPLTSGQQFTGHIDTSYTTWTAAVFDKTSAFYRRPAYALVNLNLGLRSLPNRWRAGMFIDNVANRHADTGVYSSDTGNDLPPETRRIGLNRPRTIGLRAGVDF